MNIYFECIEIFYAHMFYFDFDCMNRVNCFFLLFLLSTACVCLGRLNNDSNNNICTSLGLPVCVGNDDDGGGGVAV